MVKYRHARLDATFAALSDPTRRAILERLGRGESSVTELARPFRISLPAVSKHVTVLELAGLVTRRRAGRVHRCRLAAGPMREAAAWIMTYRKFWERRLDALAEHLETDKQKEESP